MSASCFESHYHEALVARSAKARSTAVQEASFCKACRNVEKVGNRNGQAHQRVWPCTWVTKAPAPRKTRAIETPVAAADSAM